MARNQQELVQLIHLIGLTRGVGHGVIAQPETVEGDQGIGHRVTAEGVLSSPATADANVDFGMIGPVEGPTRRDVLVVIKEL